jgi:hypothetical protein
MDYLGRFILFISLDGEHGFVPLFKAHQKSFLLYSSQLYGVLFSFCSYQLRFTLPPPNYLDDEGSILH